MVSPEVIERISYTAQISCLGVVNEQGYRASGETQAFSGFFPRDACLSSEERFFRLSRKNLPSQILREFPVVIHPDRYKKPAEFTEEERETIINTLLPVRNSIETMARFQGKIVDRARDEEPGKIPHELRSWDYDGQTLADTANNRVLEKLALNNWCVDKDGLRYYGSIDSTPLFVMTACEYLRLTEDMDLLFDLDAHIRAAIEWMDTYGNIKGDGYIRYQAKNRHALINQGWKDSSNSINYPEGNEKVKEPIALAEVQGYQYFALTRTAKLYEFLDPEYAQKLNERAIKLKARFNKDFWMEDEKFFAQALDGENTQIRDIASNVGHLLMAGIIDDEKVPFVVNRLMQPDMLTESGIRTLSSESPNYTENDPDSYHNGSIWPHDNCIIALGLIKSGYLDEANVVRDRILEAEIKLLTEYGAKQSELFIVSTTGSLRPYKYAQQPQTWVMEADRVFTDESWPLPVAA
jgi:glycogen debranching enzyme